MNSLSLSPSVTSGIRWSTRSNKHQCYTGYSCSHESVQQRRYVSIDLSNIASSLTSACSQCEERHIEHRRFVRLSDDTRHPWTESVSVCRSYFDCLSSEHCNLFACSWKTSRSKWMIPKARYSSTLNNADQTVSVVTPIGTHPTHL